MKQIKKGEWKPVHLEGPIVEDDLSGLVGIEELSDYDINNFIKTDKQKGQKRKTVSDNLTKNKKVKLVEKIKSKKNNIEVTENEPGAFVRSPKFIKKLKNKSKKTRVKQKTEIGQIIQNENTIKCTVDELKAWSIVPLPEVLLKALADLGFDKPTPIQELTLPAAIFGRRDILGAAETGSGKTLAFGLPILYGILKLKEVQKNEKQIKGQEFQESKEDSDNEENENKDEEESEVSDFEEKEEDVTDIKDGLGCVRSINNFHFEENSSFNKNLKPLYALIITPTRELAIQIKNHLIAAAKYTDIKVAVVLGGMAAVKQERILTKGPEIVVATPGRLWELIQEGNPHLSQIDNIRYLAIDETDRMIEKYHFKELHQIIERLNVDQEKCKKRQNFVFSATLTMVHDLPRYLQKKKMIKVNSKIHKLSPDEKLKNIIEMLEITDPKIVDVTQNTAGTSSSLTECRINCGLEEKDYYLYYFLQRHPGRTLIFCNSVGCVKRLATLLTILGCSALPLHAMMAQRQRLKNLERFRDNPLGILVATDVAARGLDIPSVEHVIHYQTPRTSESYVHRSGRTARARKEGITIILIEPNEIRNYVKICSTLNRNEDLPHFPIMENMLSAVKERVKLARKLDKLELQSKRSNSETGWLQKAAKDMDIIIDENDFHIEEDKEEKAIHKHQINKTRQELKSLLSKPIFPRGFSVNYPTSSGQLNIPFVQGEQTTQKAVDVLKNHLENASKNKNHMRKLFKKKLEPIKKEASIDNLNNNKNKVVKNKDKKKFRK